MKKLKFGGGRVGRIRFAWENEKVEIFGVGGWGGGLVEADLDLGRKMKKLKFLGWGGGVGGIRFGLGKENEKVEFLGWVGWREGWGGWW